MSELTELELQREALEAEIKALRDQEFCNPENIRTTFATFMSAMGGLNGFSEMSLDQQSKAIHDAIKRMHRINMDNLWPKGHRC